MNLQGCIGFPPSFSESRSRLEKRRVAGSDAAMLQRQRRDYDQIEGDHCFPDVIEANLRLHPET